MEMTLITYITIIANFHVCSRNRDKQSTSFSHNNQRTNTDDIQHTITIR